MLDLANRSHQNPDGSNSQKALKWILIDSALICLFVLVSSLPEGVPTVNELYLTFKVGLVAFFSQLVYELGIKRYTSAGKTEVVSDE